MFWGIACLVLSIKTPRFLSEFLIPAGSSGFINNIYHTGRIVGIAKSLISKKGVFIIENQKIKRGEIYYADLFGAIGIEEKGLERQE